MSDEADDDDDDVPRLSQAARLALQEFLQEQENRDESDIKENWQLSQFWYSDSTVQHLSKAALALCGDNCGIALVSCPSLYKTINSLRREMKSVIEVKLFEFDRRFSCFEPDFVYYDYNEPLGIDSEFGKRFDVVLVDPPFLSDECLSKTAQTVRFIGKDKCKIILCTGAVMEPLANELLNVVKCSFRPMHKNNLANDFICLSNFGELSTAAAAAAAPAAANEEKLTKQ